MCLLFVNMLINIIVLIHHWERYSPLISYFSLVVKLFENFCWENVASWISIITSPVSGYSIAFVLSVVIPSLSETITHLIELCLLFYCHCEFICSSVNFAFLYWHKKLTQCKIINSAHRGTSESLLAMKDCT